MKTLLLATVVVAMSLSASLAHAAPGNWFTDPNRPYTNTGKAGDTDS